LDALKPYGRAARGPPAGVLHENIRGGAPRHAPGGAPRDAPAGVKTSEG